MYARVRCYFFTCFRVVYCFQGGLCSPNDTGREREGSAHPGMAAKTITDHAAWTGIRKSKNGSCTEGARHLTGVQECSDSRLPRIARQVTSHGETKTSRCFQPSTRHGNCRCRAHEDYSPSRLHLQAYMPSVQPSYFSPVNTEL